MKSKLVGRGGINCPCCTVMGKPAETKKALHKLYRRKVKQELPREMNDVSEQIDTT